MNESGATWNDLSELLHDAELSHLEWDRSLQRVALTFDCLRWEAGGSSLEDRPVTLLVEGVQAVAIGQEPSDKSVRPSRYQPSRQLSADDLVDWEAQPQEVDVSLNSAQSEESLLMAYRLQWLLGASDTLSALPIRLVLRFDSTRLVGVPPNDIILIVAGNGLSAFSAGAPLDLSTWAAQYAAWWKQWEKHHWDEVGESGGDGGSKMDAAIPAAEAGAPDLTYRPPSEPPVDLQINELPEGLWPPIGDWFETHHSRDWTRRALASRNLDLSLEAQAQREQKHFELEFGRWPYARQLDGWWIEGPLAEVTVRGVEHCMPDEEDPASNRESVWTFRLRHRESGWTIHSRGQGWPAYGSAPEKRDREKPWLASWKSGSVVRARDRSSRNESSPSGNDGCILGGFTEGCLIGGCGGMLLLTGLGAVLCLLVSLL